MSARLLPASRNLLDIKHANKHGRTKLVFSWLLWALHHFSKVLPVGQRASSPPTLTTIGQDWILIMHTYLLCHWYALKIVLACLYECYILFKKWCNQLRWKLRWEWFRGSLLYSTSFRTLKSLQNQDDKIKQETLFL